MKAQRVRAQTRRVAPASQRSHPKPSPTRQPYKRWRTPPIVRILQYPRRSGVVGGRHNTAARNPTAHGSAASVSVASDAGSKASAEGKLRLETTVLPSFDFAFGIVRGTACGGLGWGGLLPSALALQPKQASERTGFLGGSAVLVVIGVALIALAPAKQSIVATSAVAV